MKNSRYNIFDFIHKAWRALLYETALVLQQTDFDNTEDAVSIEHNSSSGNEDTVNLQDNMTQDMCPDRSYYLNNIRQLKQELKDLKRQFKVTKESYLDESLGKASPSTRRIDKEIKKID